MTVLHFLLVVVWGAHAAQGQPPPTQPREQTPPLPLTAADQQDLTNHISKLQAEFEKRLAAGQFPKFTAPVTQKQLQDAQERLRNNPFANRKEDLEAGAAQGDNDDTAMPKGWWDGKTDEQIASKFKMTPKEFRKASDLLLQWVDDRMGDLDELYDQTLLVGRATGVPVDRILDEQLSPALSRWVTIAQDQAGNPFATPHSRVDDDGNRQHVFQQNPIKQLIEQFREDVRSVRPHINGEGGLVDLSKLGEMAEQMARKIALRAPEQRQASDEVADLTGRVRGVDGADKGMVFSPDAPTPGLGLAGKAMKLMDDTMAEPPDVDMADGVDGIADILDSTRGVFGDGDLFQ